MVRKRVLQLLPWIITVCALYFTFRGVDWSQLLRHMGEAQWSWVVAAFLITVSSYLLRSRRWLGLFALPNIREKLSFANAYRVLILGFFMNNILPARTGELVRAHCGSKVTGETRTLVLASIALERLVDGLMLSALLVVFSLQLSASGSTSSQFLYVAWFFGAVAVGVAGVVIFRERVITIAGILLARFSSATSRYTFDRIKVFLHGLSPLCDTRYLPTIILWSVLIWFVELLVYICVAQAYGAPLLLSQAVLFMVAVNFSSLIPAAPGGIGVIEAVASAVLISFGIDKELALTMVITQHAVQYAAVGIPGALVMLRWRTLLHEAQDNSHEPAVA